MEEESNLSNISHYTAMQCPVCLDVMTGQIKLCQNGHSVCNACISTNLITTCPKCRVRMTLRRNYQLETVIQEVLNGPCLSKSCQYKVKWAQLKNQMNEIGPVECNFALSGCPVQLDAAEILNHQKICTYRSTTCIFSNNGCNESKNLAEIEEHELNCEFRMATCVIPNCDVKLKFDQIEEHEKACPHRMTTCAYSNNGCEEKLKISEMAEHEMVCEKRPMRMYLPSFNFTPIHCFICNKILTEEIYLCDFGHSSCSACNRKFDHCKCGDTASQRVPQLEFLIQELNNHLLVPCFYADDGCKDLLSLSDKNTHEEECYYRNIECEHKIYLNAECDWKGKIWDLSKHLRTCHLSTVRYITDENMFAMFLSSNSNKKKLISIIYKDYVFYCKAQRVGENIHRAVQFCGSKNELEKFSYEIVVRGIDDNKNEMSIKKTCQFYQKNVNFIDSSHAIFPMQIIEEMKNEENLHQVQVTIKINTD